MGLVRNVLRKTSAIYWANSLEISQRSGLWPRTVTRHPTRDVGARIFFRGAHIISRRESFGPDEMLAFSDGCKIVVRVDELLEMAQKQRC